MIFTELYERVIKPYTADRGVTWEVQIAEEDVSINIFHVEGLFLRRIIALLLEDQRFDTPLRRRKQGRRGALEKDKQGSPL